MKEGDIKPMPEDWHPNRRLEIQATTMTDTGTELGLGCDVFGLSDDKIIEGVKALKLSLWQSTELDRIRSVAKEDSRRGRG